MKTKNAKTLEQLIKIIDENIAFLKQNQKIDWGYLGSRGISKVNADSQGIEILRILKDQGIIQAKVPLDLIAEQWMPPNAPGHLEQLREEIDEILASNITVSTLWRDPKTSRLFVVDGGHRFEVSYSLDIPYLVCNILIEKDAEWYRNYRAKESLARADIGEFRVAAQYIKKWKDSYHNVFDPLDVLSCIKSIKKDKFGRLARQAAEVRSERQAEYACGFMQEWMDESHVSVETAIRYFRAYSIISGENEKLIGKANISTALILEADSRLRAVEHDYHLSADALTYYTENYDRILGWILETTAGNSDKKNSILTSVIKAVGTSLEKNIPLEFEKKKKENVEKEKGGVIKIEPRHSTQSIETLLRSKPNVKETIDAVKKLSKRVIKKHMLPIPAEEMNLLNYKLGDILTPGHIYAIAQGNVALFSLRSAMPPVSAALGYGLLKIAEGYIGRVTGKKAAIAKFTADEWRTGNSNILNHRIQAIEQQVCSDREYQKIRSLSFPESRALSLILLYQKNNENCEIINLSAKELALYSGIDTLSASKILGFLHKEKFINIIDSFMFSILPKFKSIPESAFFGHDIPFGLDLKYFLDKNYIVQSGDASHTALQKGGKNTCDTYRIPLPTKIRPYEELEPCPYCLGKVIDEGQKAMPMDYFFSKAKSWKIDIDNISALQMMDDFSFLSFSGTISRNTVFSIYDDSQKKVAVLQPNILGSQYANDSSYKGHVLVQKNGR